jgi:hypothetical protein
MQIARLFLLEVNDKNVLCTCVPAKASCFKAQREPLMIDRSPRVGFVFRTNVITLNTDALDAAEPFSAISCTGVE